MNSKIEVYTITIVNHSIDSCSPKKNHSIDSNDGGNEQKRKNAANSWAPSGWAEREREGAAVFSFLYLKKIKISKIYVCFGKFQKYTPVALP